MSKESEYIHKSHNVSILIYHFVCPTKYRRVVVNGEVDRKLKEICMEIEKRYEINFLEIGADKDHVHFLVQSVPIESPSEIIKKVKSLTAREIFLWKPELKKELWGSSLWSSGYFVSSVGRHGDEGKIAKYVKNQGREYEKWHSGQLRLF
jgi:putative transposase